MSCSRCQGFMVTETLFNPLEGSIHTWVPFTRCLNCGNMEDSLIRRARGIPDQLRRSTRPAEARSVAGSEARAHSLREASHGAGGSVGVSAEWTRFLAFRCWKDYERVRETSLDRG